LAEIVSARIQHLAEEARAVLHAVAVLGDDADDAAIDALVPRSVDRAAGEALLAQAGMVRERRVVHPLFRQLALATASAEAKRELHARAFELRSGAPLEVRAMHAAGAGDSFHALMLLEQQSARCSRSGDLRGAAFALQRAVDLARTELFRGELEDPLAALVLFSRKLAQALADIEAYADAEGVLREAIDIAAPNDEDRAHMLATLAQIAHARAHQTEAQSYLKEALRLARKSDARELVQSLETLERAIA
jgi:serine/threonine-protein kinase